MIIYLYIFIITSIVFLILDFIWLGLIAKDLYAKELKTLLKESVNWKAAILFYIIFVISLMIFVIIPGIKTNSVNYILIHGSLFSLSMYATYDLTNAATLKGFPTKIVIIDLFWGTFVGTTTSVLTYLIYKVVFKI